MLNIFDQFLNKITMYRVVLYYLLCLFVAALSVSFFSLLPFSPAALVASMLLVTASCVLVNEIFSKVFGVPANVESVYITAFILVLIIDPPRAGQYLDFAGFAFWVSTLAMASKYIVAIWHKHLFNPAALAVVITALVIGRSATWWVGGNIYLMPFVILLGVLVVRKIRRTDMILSFFVAALFSILGPVFVNGGNIVTTLTSALTHAPMFFFAFAMLTEPLTTPPTKGLQIVYGALVGFLFAPWIHVGQLYFTPEIALILGNVFSYAVSPKKRLVLTLKDKVKVADNTYDFIFSTGGEFIDFKAGQYLDWTLGHESPDARGNRRYFTIASSPTELDIHMGVKFYPNPSSFKHSLDTLQVGGEIMASQLAGDFTLPEDKSKKLVFIAGGIGVTPFRSMVKYLTDKNDKRVATLFYSNKVMSEIAYKDIFEEASRKIGLQTIYTITDAPAPAGWVGETGFVNEAMIRKYVPDFAERMFYISGPHAMVAAFESTLQKMGVKKSQIITDFFPGFV